MACFDELVKDYRDCQIVVTLTDFGHRCGYVRVPDRLFDIFMDKGLCAEEALEYAFDVHGGITFSTYVQSADSRFPQFGYWIGFDCAHAEDGKDLDAVAKHFGKERAEEIRKYYTYPNTHTWTTEEVEKECERLADQILEITPDYEI